MKTNPKIVAHSALALGLCLTWANGAADEPNMLFCAASQVIVCPEQGECTRGLPGTVNLPRMFRLDLKDHEVVSLNPAGDRRTSKILHLVEENDVYVLQGADGGKSWTATGV